jgi:deoxycytidylate deaminase
MTRPDRDEWHLDGTKWLAQMGDCTRRKVGALIVGPDKRFWGMGYNGSYPGGPSCLEGACPRGRHYPIEARDLGGGPGSVVIYECKYHPDSPGGRCLSCTPVMVCACNRNEPFRWPCPDAVAPGSSYDTGPGACISSHAEANAVADAQRKGYSTLPDATLYVSCEPCEGCVRHIRNTTQIAAIRWPQGVIGLP